MSTSNLESTNMQIRTKSVQRMLEPLIFKVTTLVEQHSSSNSLKGKSKNISVLCINLRQAINTYIDHGREISSQNSEMKNEILLVLDDIAINGEKMNKLSLEFASDPCALPKRVSMVKQARVLLTVVTKLLILADMVDVNVLLDSLMRVQNSLDQVKNVQDPQRLANEFKNLDHTIYDMDQRAFRRQEDLISDVRRHEMAAARAMLKKSKIILLTATKTYLNHSDLAAARENRDRVHRQVCSAVESIADVAISGNFENGQGKFMTSRLAKDLDAFDRIIVVDPVSYDDRKTRNLLEQALENIISQSAHVADSGSTREARKERIINECKQLRFALQNLLSEYSKSGTAGVNGRLDLARDQVCLQTFGLRKQLRRAVADHVSDSYVNVEGPLGFLMRAAGAGDVNGVEQGAHILENHVTNLVQVSNLVCNMSTNEAGVRTIQVAALGLQELTPQVALAARILVARPKSVVAKENLDAFADAWLQQLRLLTDAVDDVMNLDDFLAITENHLHEDIGQLIGAVKSRNGPTLDQITQLMTLRCGRVHDLVSWEMSNHEPGPYTEHVSQTLLILRDQIVVNFMGLSKHASAVFTGTQLGQIPEEELIKSAYQIQEGVRNVRKAVLNIPLNGEIDSDNDEDNEIYTKTRGFELNNQALLHEQENLLYEDDSDRARMRTLPEDDRTKIQQQVQLFRMEKAKLDKEMEKWDETGNDVIIIAKRMCMIMMEMTDFMRGMGRFKSTMDIINAAKEISDLGAQLDKLCKQIAVQCQDSVTKRDLIAYLERIALYCHQLDITSKVKADLQHLGDDSIFSALENATTLITAAKNLMNAVVMAIKASYVASTKYPKSEANATITWKMKAPSKKPLVNRDQMHDPRASIRKGEQKKQVEPFKALSEFHS